VSPAYVGAILDLVWAQPAIGMVILSRMIPRKAFHISSKSDSFSATIEQVKQRDYGKPVVFVVNSEDGDPEFAVQGSLRAELGKVGIHA